MPPADTFSNTRGGGIPAAEGDMTDQRTTEQPRQDGPYRIECHQCSFETEVETLDAAYDLETEHQSDQGYDHRFNLYLVEPAEASVAND